VIIKESWKAKGS